MNRNTRNTRNTRTARTAARFAAGIGLSLAALASASPAFAETPPAPGPGVEISDAPECTPWNPDILDYQTVVDGTMVHAKIAYVDMVNTCDIEIDLHLYRLPTSTAAFDDPGSVLEFSGGYDIKVIEDETEINGLHDWILFPADECYEVHLLAGGQLLDASRFTTPGCGELPLADNGGQRPDDDPGQPGDGAGEGELPHTGSTSGALVVLAGALTALGGAALTASRRRAVL